jgi:hypothetical protein
MLTLDHIAIAATDLEQGTREISEKLGVPLEPGGRHDRYGTHNNLLNLGELYLEVITPDPDASAGHLNWFGLHTFNGATRPASWICKTDDLEGALAHAPAGAGEIQDLARGDLTWQITVPQDGSLPLQGGWPTMMRWGKGVTSPAGSLPDRGCRLLKWEVRHPRADWLQNNVPVQDERVSFRQSDVIGFAATISTPNGPVTL